MGTVIEEQQQIKPKNRKSHTNPQSEYEDDDDKCFIMFDNSEQSRYHSNINVKNRSPCSIVINAADEEEEVDNIGSYTSTTPTSYYISSNSSDQLNSCNQSIISNSSTRITSTGTPISNESISIPSSLSMPSSSNGSGDEDDDYNLKNRANHYHNQAIKRKFNLPEWMQIGESVRISPELKFGTIGYIGETAFDSGIWVGIILDTPTGKNDGSVDGVNYFVCKPKYGIFVRPEKLKPNLKGRKVCLRKAN